MTQLHEAHSQARADLSDRNLNAVNRGARKIVELGLTDLASELVSALARVLKEPAKNDPGCRVKTQLLQALLGQDHKDADIYLRVLAYKPGRGAKAQDVGSAEMRGLAVMGLASSHFPHASEHAVDLLAEPDAVARVFAIRALAIRGESLTIRYKALQAEEAPAVTGECLESLLALEGARVVDFVAGYLEKNPEVAELAALALGASRLPEAFAPLRTQWSGLFDKRTLLIAMATLRTPEATSFLEGLVRSEADHIEALRPFGFLD